MDIFTDISAQRPPIRIGIAGAGRSVLMNHLEAICSLPGLYTVTAVCDLIKDRRDRVEKFYPELRPYRRYEDMLDRAIPVVRITGASWQRIAEELTFMLNLNHLDRNYKNLREKMFEDQPYRPVSRPAPKQEAKQEEAKKEQPAETAPAAADAPAAAPAPAVEETAPAAPAAK